MNYTEEERAIVWLCSRSEFDERERAALLRAGLGSGNFLSDFEKICARVIKDGDKRLYKSDRASREREADEAISFLERKDCFAVTLASDDYPKELKETHCPPLILYGAGNRALLKSKKLCIVGSRLTPSWAEKQGRIFAEELSKRFTIVTGFAEGGDRAAIDGALSGGNLICVLPCGLGQCYPAAHASLKKKVKERGLLLTEYPYKESARKYSFRARNRILAGLSFATLVISAGKKSGALITANYALDYGRDVFAFPHNLGSAQGEGCNGLIKKGAYLVSELDDVFAPYGLIAQKREEAALSNEEETLLTALRNAGEIHVADLAQLAGMPVYEVAATLSALEMKNLAAKAGGNRYTAV